MSSFWSLLISDALHLLFNLAQEASLEPVLSGALSVKHASNMRKSYTPSDLFQARIEYPKKLRPPTISFKHASKMRKSYGVGPSEEGQDHLSQLLIPGKPGSGHVQETPTRQVHC